MNIPAFQIGDRVMCNGYEGRVVETSIGVDNALVVRVPGGRAVAFVNELIRFTPPEWLAENAARAAAQEPAQ